MVAAPERLRPREELLPHGELEALRRPLLRAAAFRAVLALALAAAFAAALTVAFSRDARSNALLPPGTTGMIVLDLSASTGAQLDVGELFRRIVAGNEGTGLVVFSDGAYELVPPGTAGRELAPMIRLFSLGPRGIVPDDPWSANFTGGTNVVAGIERALASLRRDRIARGSILLISDLEYLPDQTAELPRLLSALRRRDIELRILPVDAREEQRRFFERVLGADVFVDVDAAGDVATGGGSPRGLFWVAEDGTPWLFAGLASLMLVLLALNEWLCARLQLPSPAGSPR